jgi:hypothetical protein
MRNERRVFAAVRVYGKLLYGKDEGKGGPRIDFLISVRKKTKGCDLQRDTYALLEEAAEKGHSLIS